MPVEKDGLPPLKPYSIFIISVVLGFLRLSNRPLSVHRRNRRNGYPTTGVNMMALTGGFAMDESMNFDFDSSFRRYLRSSMDVSLHSPFHSYLRFLMEPHSNPDAGPYPGVGLHRY